MKITNIAFFAYAVTRLAAWWLSATRMETASHCTNARNRLVIKAAAQPTYSN
jgi:hypothetical protein